MSSSPTLAVPQSVGQAISRYRMRKTLLRAGAWIGLGVTVGLFLFIAALVADRFLDMSTSTRLIITIATFAAPAIPFLTGLWTLFRQHSAETIAGEIDDAVPGARDLLRSSVNLGLNSAATTGPDREFMLNQTFAQANAVGQAVNPARILGWGRVPVAFVGIVILVPAIVVLFKSPMMDSALLLNRFLHPTGNLPRPSLTKVQVDFPDVKTIQQGDDVTILASLAGTVPEDPHVGVDIVTTNPSAPGRVLTVVMTPRPGNAFEATLKNVVEPVTFTVWAADGRSERHTIAVTPRPSVVSLIAHYASPSYAQLPPAQGPIQLREFKALEGTRVRVEFETSIPVAESKVVFPDRQVSIRWDVNRTKGVFQFTIEKETTFNIQLVSDTRSDNHNEGPYRVRIVPDSPPTVSLLGVPENLTYYRDDVINLAYKGSDDFGVSDVFIRYRVSGLSAPSRDYSLKSVVGAVREVSADFSLPLRDLTTDETDWIEIELVMVDTKGQEGVSPPVRFQIVSNTPDRQLQELIAMQERYAATVNHATGNLKSSAFRLGVLVEGMDANDKLTGSRKESFDEISRDLWGISFPIAADDQAYFRMLPVSEYPYLIQRRTHDLFSRAAALPDQSTFGPLLDAALKSESPRVELSRLKKSLDASLPQAQSLCQGLKSLVAEANLTLLDFVATDYMAAAGRIAAAAPPAGAAKAKANGKAPDSGSGEPSAEAVALLQEKQETRLRTILASINTIEAYAGEQAELLKFTGAVKSAAAQPVGSRNNALIDAIGAIRRRLDDKGELDGRLAIAAETYLRQNPWPTVFQNAAKTQSLAKASTAVSSWTRLIRNSVVFNTPQAVLACAAQQAAQRATSEDDAHLAQTLSAAVQLEDWSRQGDLYERVELLRRTLANMEIETRVGRLNPKNPSFDNAWRQVREIYLSITSDAVAGRFEGLSPQVNKGLAALVDARAGFSSWDWHDSIGSPAWTKNRADANKTLCDLAAALLPGVRDGRAKAVPLTNGLLADLDQNIIDEHSRVVPELALIQADVAAAALAPPGEINSVTNEGKVLGRKANFGRIRFTKLLSERFSSYANAIAAINDLRQAAWADQPTGAALPELEVLAVLYEFISNLDEDVYDNTYAIHLQQILRTRRYPQFVEETGRYMDGLTVPAGIIDSAVKRFLAGDAAKLAADAQFMGLPMSVNKQVRFNAHRKSLAQQLEFTQGYQPAMSEKARIQLFQAISKDAKIVTPYWDQFYLACQDLHRLTGASVANVKPGDAAQWTGVDAQTLAKSSALVARIRNMLPTGQAPTDETKAIGVFLEDFETVQARVAAEKVGGLSPAARSDAFDLYDEWRGKIQAALQVMDTRVTIPVVKQRPRGRLLSSRADIENIISRLVRSESEWTDRIVAAERTTQSTRAKLLIPPDSDPVTTDDLAFDFAREGQIRRRSAAALSQSSRDINVDSGGVDEKFLKMPKYLYDELVRAAKKPYPSQFEESGKTYTQGLFKDAR